MPLVIETELEKKKKAPHLALTHNEIQGGAANGRNVTLFTKSDIEITPEIAALLKAVTGEEIVIEKASYEMLRKKLNDAIEKFSTSRWDWTYVEDFDESNVVFTCEGGLYTTTYTVDGNNVTLANEAFEVNRLVSYQESDGKIVLSQHSDGVSSSVHSLVVKSFDSISNNEKIKDIFKSKLERGKEEMQTEIQKAVETATAAAQVDLQKAQADLQKANEDNLALKAKVEAFEKAQADSKASARLAAVKEVQADEEKATVLAKSLEALDDASFETVLKSMKEVNEKVENSDLFKTVSKQGDEVADEGETMKLLKARWAEKQ